MKTYEAITVALYSNLVLIGVLTIVNMIVQHKKK